MGDWVLPWGSVDSGWARSTGCSLSEGSPVYQNCPLWGQGPGLILSLCLYLREKEKARREKARENESQIAAREVQGLVDTIGEPQFGFKHRSALGRREPLPGCLLESL